MTSDAGWVCPTNATLEPPTVKFVNVPELAVKVDALTELKVPVPFTVIELASMLTASIVAEETTKFVVLRFVNTPLVF